MTEQTREHDHTFLFEIEDNHIDFFVGQERNEGDPSVVDVNVDAMLLQSLIEEIDQMSTYYQNEEEKEVMNELRGDAVKIAVTFNSYFQQLGIVESIMRKAQDNRFIMQQWKQLALSVNIHDAEEYCLKRNIPIYSSKGTGFNEYRNNHIKKSRENKAHFTLKEFRDLLRENYGLTSSQATTFEKRIILLQKYFEEDGAGINETFLNSFLLFASTVHSIKRLSSVTYGFGSNIPYIFMEFIENFEYTISKIMDESKRVIN